MIGTKAILIGCGALVLASSVASFRAGHDRAENKALKREAQAVEDAIEETTRSMEAQRIAAQDDVAAVMGRNADLLALLRNRQNAEIPTGRNCIIERDAIELRDVHYEIFEDRLLSGGGVDGEAQPASGTPNDN